MPLPNFFFVGAARSGTTSVYRHLNQHPQIYMCPMKDPQFFAYRFEGDRWDFRGPADAERPDMKHPVNTIKAYEALFDGVSDETAIGDASHLYLYMPPAPQRIRRYIPDAKIIVILRDPNERAFSAYLNEADAGWEPVKKFIEAFEDDENRIRNNWCPAMHYKSRGFYHAQLTRYLDIFDKNRIRVYLYEDLQSDSVGLMQDMFRFLGVDDTFVPDTSIRHNERRRVPRSRSLHQILTEVNTVRSILSAIFPQGLRSLIREKLISANIHRPKLPYPIRKQLIEVYREDILRLQDLIQRDLSKWLD